MPVPISTNVSEIFGGNESLHDFRVALGTWPPICKTFRLETSLGKVCRPNFTRRPSTPKDVPKKEMGSTAKSRRHCWVMLGTVGTTCVTPTSSLFPGTPFNSHIQITFVAFCWPSYADRVYIGLPLRLTGVPKQTALELKKARTEVSHWNFRLMLALPLSWIQQPFTLTVYCFETSRRRWLFSLLVGNKAR